MNVRCVRECISSVAGVGYSLEIGVYRHESGAHFSVCLELTTVIHCARFCVSVAILGTRANLREQSSEEFAKVQNVNIVGTFYALKHQIPAMIKNGGGSIINNTSSVGLKASPNYGQMSAYVTSKFAQTGLTYQVRLRSVLTLLRGCSALFSEVVTFSAVPTPFQPFSTLVVQDTSYFESEVLRFEASQCMSGPSSCKRA